MKFLLAVSISLFTVGAFAEDLGAMKSAANSKIERQLSDLQKSKSCVSSAATVDAFKACKVDVGVMQKEEVKVKETTKTKDKSLSDKMKDGYNDVKEDVDDAL